MKKSLMIVIPFAAIVMVGCSSKAGPFVTNISSDGRGGLVVEKCMVRLDRTINTVESSDCTNTTLALSNQR